MTDVAPEVGPDASASLRLRSLAFDRLGSAVAIVDDTGTIVDTNDAWRLFAHLNGGTAATTGIGVSYLEVCDRAADGGDRLAGAVSAGLRRILAGDEKHFDVEYPCNSLTVDQWFLFQASAVNEHGATSIVVVHVDITAEKRLRSQLERASGEGRGQPTDRRRRALRRRRIRPPDVGDPGAIGPNDLALHHHAVLDALGEGVLVQDPLGRLLYANRRATILIPPMRRALDGSTDRTVVVDSAGTPMSSSRLPGRRALSEDRSIEDEIIGLRTIDGKVRWLEISSHPMRTPGEPTAYAVVSAVRDVTARREAGDLLALKARLLDSVGQAVVAWDTSGRITFVNAKAEEMYGWSREAAIGQQIADVIELDTDADPHQADGVIQAADAGLPWEGELLIGRADGTTMPVWSSSTPILEAGAVIGHIGVSNDITARKLADAHLAHLVRHDVLTDLVTRRTLAEQVAVQIAALGPSCLAAVILLDIGSLNLLNDAFNHSTGDAAILRCADLLRRAVHPGDGLARFSDHSFAVSCTHAADPSEMEAYADRLRDAVSAPFVADALAINLQVSASVATTGPGDCRSGELIRRADTALVRARQERTTRVYHESMGEEILRQVHVGDLVRRILATGVVGLGYQPVVRLSDQMTVGAEALLRVLDDGEPVSPVEIVEAAERSGQIPELGELILRTACADAAAWPRAASGRPVGISVNLSARQLDDPLLAQRVQAALDASGLPPTSLCLEITEGALMADPARAATQLGALRASGIRFAADDFGTGYSSLAYLKALPLDALKIDQSFVAGLPENLEDVAITQAVLAMSDALGLSVTAEGVETEQQLGALLELGTGFGQGYLWGKAMPTAAFAARIVDETDAPASMHASTTPTPWRIQRPTDALGSSEERIDSILGIIAHEIRTPLSVVSGYAHILEDTDDPAEADAAAAIGRAADRITRILTNMVDLSAEGGGVGSGHVRVIDAVLAAQRVLDDQLPTGAVTLRSPSEAGGSTLIEIDTGQFAQVVTNLLSNAAKFSPLGSPIELSVAEAGGWVDVSVSDQGPGISADDLGLIFRKYGRTDPLGNGTGLGLYLARQIARSHGGDILYRRGSPIGSVFVLRLPRAEPATEPAA